MKHALDSYQKTIKASWAKKGVKYYCPKCKELVIPKQGKVKTWHFAHKMVNEKCKGTTATNDNKRANIIKKQGPSETFTHKMIKEEIAQCISEYPGVYDCELERELQKVRPDVSFQIGNNRVVVEIQRSNIDCSDILRRMQAYYEERAKVVWVLPEETLDSRRLWQWFLHTLNFGRLYVWLKQGYVRPMHFLGNNKKYWKTLHLVKDFHPVVRSTFKTKYYEIPLCRIWMDNVKKWW